MSSMGNISSIYQRPAELVERLIQFDTTNPPGNESECISFINGLLTEAGIETKVLSKTPERPNLVTRLLFIVFYLSQRPISDRILRKNRHTLYPTNPPYQSSPLST